VGERGVLRGIVETADEESVREFCSPHGNPV